MSTDREDYEALQRYLLGELPEPEADRIERRLIEDGELAELADAVEEELLEECRLGELSLQRCAGLIKRMAATPAGRDRLAFYGILPKPRPVVPVSILTWVRQHAPAWRPALAAAALAVFVAGLTWRTHDDLRRLIFPEKPAAEVQQKRDPGRNGAGNRPPARRPSEDPRDRTAEPGERAPQAGDQPRVPAPPAQPPAHEPQRAPEPQPEPLPVLRSELTLALHRDASELEVLEIVVNEPGKRVEIEIYLDPPVNQSELRATIGDPTGHPLWTSGKEDVKLENDGALLVVRPPATLLRTGSLYALKVEGVKEADTDQTDLIGVRKFEVVAQ